MNEIKLIIDGREVIGTEGQTILAVAQENGIHIPTLCHDERVEMYGSCGICTVEAEGNPKLLRSCSTLANNGMVIHTDTERIRQNRKTALELLLSDHTGDCRPPCVLACPAQTDCQGYVGLIANGEYKEAYNVIKDKLPFPASLGRVCPHPCEEACRRKLVEEPISIAALKQFAGDLELYENLISNTAKIIPEKDSSGKNCAVVGGGPGGLSAAYFLRERGHEVTVYDAMPQMGGMFRYGIPKYRLPKRLLSEEINLIEKTGLKFRNNVKIGRDITLDTLRNTYDAVVLAMGAWTSTKLRCPGEDLENVVGGIDFLRQVALEPDSDYCKNFKEGRVAVVGGGNTAMDACRTAVRLGASEVYNIYRRTKNEMPAEEIEIMEAEEEGVIFKNLTNPIEVVGSDDKVRAIKLQIMELGEPDASGRRAPVPVEGKEELIEVDFVIVAIGQKLSSEGFEQIELTKWGTIAADENTLRTNLDGVFAIGDATNKGADIAVSAIGEAKKAAEMVNKYLNGEEIKFHTPFLVKTEKTSDDFSSKAKEPRINPRRRPASERRNDFKEINLSLTEDEAKKEASRCLECGCRDYFECKLVAYANEYNVNPEKYDGKTHHYMPNDNHPFIHRNPEKCILCGLCARICDEVIGAAALGLVDRGFDTVVKPALDMDLRDTDCISCGQCVSVCPTGALTEKLMIGKQVPLKESTTETTCAFCSVGCKSKLSSGGNLLLRNLPSSENGSLLCNKGRFGFGEMSKKERINTPLVRGENGFGAASIDEAAEYINSSFNNLKKQYGDCIGFAISGRYTNEEIFIIKEYAQKVFDTDNIFSFGKSNNGTVDVLGQDLSTATFDDLENAELIIAVTPENIVKNHAVSGMKIKHAVKKGARLIVFTGEKNILNDISEMTLSDSGDMEILRQTAKALLDSGHGKDIDGFKELEDSLKEISIGKEAEEIAGMLLNSNRVVFIYTENNLTVDGSRLIADIAVLSGHESYNGSGLIRLLPEANSQGLAGLGIKPGEDYFRAVANGEIRGLFVFGEDVSGLDLDKLDFLAVQELHMTDLAKRANVILPAAGFSEVKGSFIGTDGIIREVNPAINNIFSGFNNFDQIIKLSENANISMQCKTAADVKNSFARDASSGDIKIRLAAVNGNILRKSEYLSTNELCNNFMKFAKNEGLI